MLGLFVVRVFAVASLLFLLLTSQCDSLSVVTNRRVALAGLLAGALPVQQAHAAAVADCYTDCLKNCKLIAPNDTAYCRDNCRDYCEQPDRQDGLSGSIGSERGETGILGIGTVVKGQDKPPSISLPGLDFTSTKGKKLIGYD